uniref:SET domain and mariner transposase fusion gene n=1 Tax=Callorhinchus milii TaxID=7868 RepID=A0A4W3GE12_CALMI
MWLQYTPENVAGAGAELDPAEVTLPGCDCLAPSCARASCACLQRHGAAYDEGGRLTVTAAGAGPSPAPVFECHVMCRCGETCANRVVQRGSAWPLEVFKTPGKGWGLRSAAPIRRGCFVCEYAGEVLGHAEASARVRAQAPGDANYVIAVREHLSGGRTLQTFVDPSRVGNAGRYLNHSCRPNLYMVPVRVGGWHPRLALFAARDIPARQELCYDYSGRFNNDRDADTDADAARAGLSPGESRPPSPADRKPCLCGSEDCSGFLPFDPSLYPPESETL